MHIDGPERGISFESFVGLLNRSLLILKDTDRAITAKPTGVLDWVVVDLSSQQGLNAVIESKARPRAVVDDRMVKRITASYVDALAIAERGEALPPHLSDAALSQLQWMAGQLQRNGAEALRTTYIEEQQDATITPETAGNVKRLRVPKSEAIGSIIGLLEVVSVHKHPKYSVYDAVTERPVSAKFKPSEIDVVKEALGRRVRVSGLIRRNAKGQPLSVEQPRLSVLPPTDQLPSTDDLIGLDPDFTGDLSTDEYVRRLRDA